MRSKDATELEIIELRGTRKFTLPIPLNIPDRDATVRSATRPVDEQIDQPPKFWLLGLLVSALTALLVFWIFVILVWI